MPPLVGEVSFDGRWDVVPQALNRLVAAGVLGLDKCVVDERRQMILSEWTGPRPITKCM